VDPEKTKDEFNEIKRLKHVYLERKKNPDKLKNALPRIIESNKLAIAAKTKQLLQ